MMSLNQELLPEIIQQLPGFFLVMDLSSRFLYSNKSTCFILGYKNVDQMLGDTARTIPCKAAEFADEFINQDQHVIQSQSTISLLDIHRYAMDTVKMYLTTKTPFYSKGKLSGLICQCTELEQHILTIISTLLVETDKKYYNTVDRSYTLGKVINHVSLPERELDCLYYLLRGKTMKETAKILDISWRTVETYINRIKTKWQCHTKSDLIDYAVSHGYLTYIPAKTLSVMLS